MDDAYVLLPAGLDAMVVELRRRAFTVLGPRVRDGAVVIGEVHGIADLPAGVGDEQDGGRYRLVRRDDQALFSYAVGPQSWKAVFFPPRLVLRRRGEPPAGAAEDHREGPYALLGVRSCDLAALAVHDRVLAGRAVVDEDYVRRRRQAFVVAVTCGVPSGTCFCVSMGTGPVPGNGYDVLLTEVLDGGHRFVAAAGTPVGRVVLDAVAHHEAGTDDVAAADAVGENARTRMGRHLETEGLRDLLYANAEHPQWEDVASRCLACGSCTMACPTCFCTTVTDTGDLSGERAERRRQWDSCFEADFSYLHGGSVRASRSSRYRQWATHKLAAWQDQFGTSGCVGCGRCITWCPVGIDLVAEVTSIQARPR